MLADAPPLTLRYRVTRRDQRQQLGVMLRCRAHPLLGYAAVALLLAVVGWPWVGLVVLLWGLTGFVGYVARCLDPVGSEMGFDVTGSGLTLVDRHGRTDLPWWSIAGVRVQGASLRLDSTGGGHTHLATEHLPAEVRTMLGERPGPRRVDHLAGHASVVPPDAVRRLSRAYWRSTLGSPAAIAGWGCFRRSLLTGLVPGDEVRTVVTGEGLEVHGARFVWRVPLHAGGRQRRLPGVRVVAVGARQFLLLDEWVDAGIAGMLDQRDARAR